MSPSGPNHSDNHFGTVRLNQNTVTKMQEALNLSFPSQKQVQRPTIRPPAPPVPSRGNATNLSNQSHAKSTTALNNSDQLSAPRRLPNSGSSNNISSMERSGDQTDVPPLPPHRLSSQTQLKAPALPVANAPAPEVPRRHSSMRNSTENGPRNRVPANNNPDQSVTRLVVDLESRYSLLFHNISEFPSPKPFLNLEKSYPSRAVRPANGI